MGEVLSLKCSCLVFLAMKGSYCLLFTPRVEGNCCSKPMLVFVSCSVCDHCSQVRGVFLLDSTFVEKCSLIIEVLHFTGNDFNIAQNKSTQELT